MIASIYKCLHLLFNFGAVDFTSLSCTRILNLNISSFRGIELNENKPNVRGWELYTHGLTVRRRGGRREKTKQAANEIPASQRPCEPGSDSHLDNFQQCYQHRSPFRFLATSQEQHLTFEYDFPLPWIILRWFSVWSLSALSAPRHLNTSLFPQS